MTATSKVLALTAVVLLVGIGIGVSLNTLLAPTPTAMQPVSPQKIVIAIQPTQTSAELTSRSQQLEQFLESEVGVDIEIYVPTTYAAVVEALRFGNADVAFMSAWPTYIASKMSNADIVLAEVREVLIGEEKSNEPFYFSYWVVPKGSAVNSLSELQGKKVCLPSQISTSGYAAPLGRMVELGLIKKPDNGAVDPKAFFGDVLYGGGYSQCWTALKAGQVDATVIAGDVAESLYREVLTNTKVIEQQGPIPSHGVVFSKNLGEPLRSKLVNALLKLGEPEHRDLMRKFISGIFVSFKTTTTEEHMAGLQKYLGLTGLRFTESLG
jgi:phosphonate transport system substrate-binding protein